MPSPNDSSSQVTPAADAKVEGDPKDAAKVVPVRSPARPKSYSLSLPLLAGIALILGLAQLVAATTLELSSPAQLSAAQARGPEALWWLLGSIALGVAAIYKIRDRQLTSFLSTLLWAVATTYGITRSGHGRDLAFFGEPVAYHLLALLCTVLIWSICWRWLRNPELGGRKRALPAILACSAASILLLEHLGSSVSLLEPLTHLSIFSGSARALGLLSWPVALWVLWPKLAQVPARVVPLLGTILLTIRIAAAGPEGLLGATVSGDAVPVLGTAFVLIAMATAITMRPRLALYVHLLLALVSLGACMLFLQVYYSGYGTLEDGLSGILRSLFGFDIPLPFTNEPGWWRPAVVMVGIFFLFYSSYASIVSGDDRRKGIGLGLMLLAGLNLLSPYLVLMLCAGGLFMVDALLEEGHVESSQEQTAASTGLMNLLEELANRLGIEAPVRIAGQRGEVLKLFGLVQGRPVEVLIRTQVRGPAQAELIAGVLGRADPTLSLIPDTGTRGKRPSHLLARTHRINGEPRMLEALGDRPLDSLMPFPDASMHYWEGGVFCQLGPSISRASVDELESLVRGAARTASPS